MISERAKAHQSWSFLDLIGKRRCGWFSSKHFWSLDQNRLHGSPSQVCNLYKIRFNVWESPTRQDSCVLITVIARIVLCTFARSLWLLSARLRSGPSTCVKMQGLQCVCSLDNRYRREHVFHWVAWWLQAPDCCAHFLWILRIPDCSFRKRQRPLTPILRSRGIQLNWKLHLYEQNLKLRMLRNR